MHHAAHLLVALALTAGTVHAQEVAGPTEAEAVARRFYDAFVRGDTATLEGLYAPDVRFRDAIFSFDDRAKTMDMWSVLLDPASGGTFTYELLGASGETARARWIADYKVLGRPVHNVITATLTVRGGKIVQHLDDFSWDRWARQAFPLGPASSWRPVKHVLQTGVRLVLKNQIARKKKAAAAAAPRNGIADALPGD
jgi:ketosteroid isomerase-like protein